MSAFEINMFLWLIVKFVLLSISLAYHLQLSVLSSWHIPSVANFSNNPNYKCPKCCTA